jgi:hypothetical protein
MESLEESLDILGLADGASWDEINVAYKDLIRVWHPDRFQSDERLRKRAEEQTRLLNTALEALRKGYKDPKRRLKNRTQAATSQQRAPEQQPAPTADPTWRQTFNAVDTSTTFVPAPFLVYQTLSASLIRILLSIGIACLGLWLSFATANPGREKVALGCIISFFAMSWLVRNILIVATHTPVFSIDRRGITTIESGLIGWSEIVRVWTGTQAGTYCLLLRLSDSYLKRQPLHVRILLKLRHFFRHSHISVPGAAFDVHPNDVIRAIDLRHLSGDILLHLKGLKLRPSWVPVARLVALLAATIPIIRILLKLPVGAPEHVIYLAAFSMCHTAAFLGTPLKTPRK